MEFGTVARVAVPLAILGAVGVAATLLLHDGDDDVSAKPKARTAPPSQAGDGASQLKPHTPAQPVAPARRTYVNPVFEKNAPDPAVVRGDDGMFYAFTTASGSPSFQVLRSADLTSWERIGDAFRGDGPDWISEHRWAPDVVKTGDHYTMTYSARGHDGNMKIGYATSNDAAGPFKDRGVLLEGASVGYYIDPNLKQVGDSWMLYYGSTGGAAMQNRGGISAVPIAMSDDGTLKPKGAAKVVLSEVGERELVEGAWVHERDGQYYMFYSDGKWDAKGGSQDYALNVARGPSPDGPFTKLDTPVLEAGHGYSSTGHNSIVTDDAGQDWVIYHAWGPDKSKGRMLMMDPIEWKDGWPVINHGRGPSKREMDAPVITAQLGATALRAD